jgi:bifunctional N-acetylglucosamine-1-phosphate-uridyltransferase/glucosamine-1-phosphate-acetyltransferase GlmU-like protein
MAKRANCLRKRLEAAMKNEVRLPGLRALVPAAGKGSRAGLPFPKTLFPIQGKPILVRIHEVLAPHDPQPSIVVSPAGYVSINDCLQDHGCRAHLVLQPEARGMGDAVLRFADSPAYAAAEHVLLVWGDIPFLQSATVDALLSAHAASGNDFTFATRHVERAYTVVSRDIDGRVTGIRETREAGVADAAPGERDIGLFVFRKEPVFALLQEELPGSRGGATGEFGFLHVVAELARRGLRVEGVSVATELETVSLNAMKDIEAFV